MTTNQKFALGIIATVALLVVGLVIRGNKWTLISYSDMQPNITKQFMSLAPVLRDTQTGTLVLRTNDLKQQFISGDWRILFEPKNLFAVEASIKTSPDGTQKLIAITANGTVKEATLPTKYGNIVTVHKSENGEHVFIQFLTEKSTIFCVTSFPNSDDAKCQQWEVSSKADGIWHQNDLIVLTEKQEIFVFDPVGKKVKKVFSDTSADTYKELHGLFTPKPVVAKSLFPNFKLFPYFLTAKTYQLDPDHALLVRPNNITVYEFSTKRKATLIKDAGITSKTKAGVAQ